MTSIRYIKLVIIYILGHFFSKIKYDAEYLNLLNNQLFVLGISTFIFFLFIKFKETNCNDKNKKGLPTKYIYTQSIFYTILAILSHYIYKFFLEQDCIDIIAQIFNSINDLTYIPESLFIAGFVLLINNLSLYIIYPKCN
jgi:hypothetical protein